MIKKLLTALAISSMAISMSVCGAWAGNTKIVTDHAGNRVEIPTNPKRIASLHTLSTTHMLWDLNAPLIGTATRILKSENRPYIRSVEETFGVKFQDTNLFNYGKKGSDLEKIKVSKPDLIVGTHEHIKNYKKLSTIAPTIIINQGVYNMFDVYRDLAGWVNRMDTFNAKQKIYRERLAKVKKKFTIPPNKETIAYVLPRKGKAQIEVRKHYGAMTHVAFDLGFKMAPFTIQQFPDTKDVGGKISSEFMPKVKSDWLFSTYNNQRNENDETVYSGLDDVAPGWRSYNQQYTNKKIIVFPREESRPMSFKVMNMVLDVFEKNAK